MEWNVFGWKKNGNADPYAINVSPNHREHYF